MTLPDFLLAQIGEDEAVVESARQYPGGHGYWSRRVLAECVAKREVIRLYRQSDREGYENAACYLLDALRALASVYADHPEYRDEWR